MVAITISGMILLPFSLPILPPDLTVQYLSALGLSIRLEKGAQPALPQYLGQRLGWQELTATVADVYHRLPPAGQAQATIITPYYPVAGAIEFYSGEYGLPRPISGHNNYYLWGFDDASGEVAIAIGEVDGEWHELYDEVTQVATTPCFYCSGSGLPVYVTRGLKAPLQVVWPQLKRYQ
jgi:hypothetical protein